MKKPLIFILLMIFFAFSLYPFSPVFAKTDEYGRIINTATPFYKDAEKKETLFYLPYTYYVKILGEENDLYKIECGGETLPALIGYTDKGALFFDGLTVNNPYPEIKIRTRADTPFFADAGFNSVIQYVFAERELLYYGAIPDGTGGYAFFVSYNQRLGYVKEENVYPFTTVNHPNELTFIPPTEQQSGDASQSTSQNGATNGIKLAVILSLVFAGIVALFVSLFPKKKKTPPSEISDDGERE